jgi:hypothetical protein
MVRDAQLLLGKFDAPLCLGNKVIDLLPQWIDLEKCVAGVYVSQLTPPGHQQAIKLLTEFEKFVYQSVEKLETR